MNRRHALALFITALAARALPAAAQAGYPRSDRYPTGVVLRWTPETGQLRAEFRPGCLSGSLRYLRHDITARLDRASRTFHIDGGFWYEARSAIGTMDCGQHQVEEATFERVLPGDYSLVRDGRAVGQIALTEVTGSWTIDERARAVTRWEF